MNKFFKILTLGLFSTTFTFSVYATESADPIEAGNQIVLHRDDDQQGADHNPHRSTPTNTPLPLVYLNSDDNSLTFSSSSNTSFTYYIYDPGINVISAGTIRLEESHSNETVIIHRPTSGNYKLVIEIDGTVYYGIFELD